MHRRQFLLGSAVMLATAGCIPYDPLPVGLLDNLPKVSFDVIIYGGTVYDGTGAEGRRADIGISGDRITAVGVFSNVKAPVMIDARGMAVAPGFINMLSWANETLLVDGLSQSDIRQGVTLEVMGEGDSMGPLTPLMKRARSSSRSAART